MPQAAEGGHFGSLPTYALALTPDEEFLYVAGRSGRIEKLNLVSRTFSLLSLHHGSPVRALLLDRSGARLMSGGADGTLRRSALDPPRKLLDTQLLSPTQSAAPVEAVLKSEVNNFE